MIKVLVSARHLLGRGREERERAKAEYVSLSFREDVRFSIERMRVSAMSNEIETQQETKQWGSRFGYIMVAAGAAVGLGNIWKFPYLAYNNGGGAFMIGFIVCAILLAYPMVKIETAIGRAGRGDTVGCYKRLVPKTGFIGWVATICTMLINFFYVVVGGWVLKYFTVFITNQVSAAASDEFFTGFITQPAAPVIFFMIYAAATVVIVMFGVEKGVEKASRLMMPLLIIMTVTGKEVAARSSDVIDRGSTEIKAKGSYTQDNKDVLLCACSKSQAYMVRRLAHEIDKNVFIMVTETNEVYGEGFLEEKPKQ